MCKIAQHRWFTLVEIQHMVLQEYGAAFYFHDEHIEQSPDRNKDSEQENVILTLRNQCFCSITFNSQCNSHGHKKQVFYLSLSTENKSETLMWSIVTLSWSSQKVKLFLRRHFALHQKWHRSNLL